MKRIYLVIVALFATIVAMTASAQEEISITLVIDNPDAVTVNISSQKQEIVAGNNVFTFGLYTQLEVRPNSNYAITSITDKDGNVVSLNDYYLSKYFYSTDDNGQIYTVSTKELNRICSFVLVVRDADKVKATFSGSGEVLPLVSGSGTFAFDPEIERELILTSTSTKKIFQITVNDEPITVEWTNRINLSEGLTIVVDTEYPDMPCNITIQLPELIDYSCIQSVTVDGRENGHDSGLICCKAYDEVSISFKPEYEVKGYSFDGVEQSMEGFTGSINFTPIDLPSRDFIVYVDIQLRPTLYATVIVDNPDNVCATLQYDPISLNAGENVIEFKSNASTFSVSDSAIGKVSKLTKTSNGEETDITGTYFITLEDGMILNVETTAKDLPNSFVLYVEGSEACDNAFGLSNSDWEEYKVAEGYNIIPFNDGELKLSLSGETVDGNQSVWINYEQVGPKTEGGNYWKFTPSDGDVVKAFALNPTPDTYQVTFNVDGDEMGNPMTIKDKVVSNENWKSFTVLGSTEIQFSCDADVLAEVRHGEELIELTKTEDSQSFLFTVTKNTSFDVKFEDAGLENVFINQESDNDNVYNLNGIRIGKRSDLNSLPKGLYIVGNKKVTVK